MLTDFTKSGALQEHITNTLQPAYAKRYRLLMDTIQKTLVPQGVTLPQPNRDVVGGYFVWIELPKPLLAEEVAARVREDHNVIVAPGPLFGVYGDERTEELARAIRLCFSWEDKKLLVEGVTALAAAVEVMLQEAKDGVKYRVKRSLAEYGNTG